MQSLFYLPWRGSTILCFYGFLFLCFTYLFIVKTNSKKERPEHGLEAFIIAQLFVSNIEKVRAVEVSELTKENFNNIGSSQDNIKIFNNIFNKVNIYIH